MIVRKWDYLNLNDELKNIEIEIYQNQKIGLIYVPDKGYVIYEENDGSKEDIIFIKTRTEPKQYNEEELKPKLLKNKKEFIELISMITNEIYENEDIKEYEKKHPEYLFIELFDNLAKDDCPVMTRNDPFYQIVDSGFIRLELDQFKNFARSTTMKIMNLVNSEPQNMDASNSLDEKLKNFNNKRM